MKKSNSIGIIASFMLMLMMGSANSADITPDLTPKTVQQFLKKDARIKNYEIQWKLYRDFYLNEEVLSIAKTVEPGDTKALASKVLQSINNQGLGGNTWNELPISAVTEPIAIHKAKKIN